MSNAQKPLIEAALGKKPSRHPVWFMRQAGRYLPEYREVRAKNDFLTVCKTPALAAEVTLQPLRRYDLDGAIIFSDILIPSTGMGQTLTFDKGEGPVLTPAIRSAADLKALKHPHAERDLGYVGEAIAKTKAGLGAPQAMIGFAGAPFTVASYMIEGSGSKNYTEVKKLMLNDTATFRGLLELIADVTVDYLVMQSRAGADLVVLFDTWAGQLSGQDYKTHVFPVTQRLVAAVRKAGIAVAYYPGQGADKLFEIAGLDLNVVAIDWRTRLSNAIRILKEVGLNPTVQGNLDPQLLMADEATIRARVRGIVEEGRAARAHIFNVGHGLLPHTPPAALGWVVDELRK